MPCENDRHVTDAVKHEVKHAFQPPQDYGADLDDIMFQTGRSKNASDTSSRKKGLGGTRSSQKSLQRKSTMKVPTLNNTLDAVAFA